MLQAVQILAPPDPELAADGAPEAAVEAADTRAHALSAAAELLVMHNAAREVCLCCAVSPRVQLCVTAGAFARLELCMNIVRAAAELPVPQNGAIAFTCPSQCLPPMLGR